MQSSNKGRRLRKRVRRRRSLWSGKWSFSKFKLKSALNHVQEVQQISAKIYGSWCANFTRVNCVSAGKCFGVPVWVGGGGHRCRLRSATHPARRCRQRNNGAHKRTIEKWPNSGSSCAQMQLNTINKTSSKKDTSTDTKTFNLQALIQRKLAFVQMFTVHLFRNIYL